MKYIIVNLSSGHLAYHQSFISDQAAEYFIQVNKGQGEFAFGRFAICAVVSETTISARRQTFSDNKQTSK